MDYWDIVKARRKHKVSQRRLCKALGLSTRTVLTDVESGKIGVTEQWVKQVVDVTERLGKDNAAA